MSQPAAISPLEQSIFKGLQFHEQGLIAEAQSHYLDVLTHKPSHPAALHLFGLTLYQQDRLNEAEVVLNKARELAPRKSTVIADQGVVYLAQNKINEAISCFDDALLYDPNLASAWNNRGAAFEKAGKLKQAIESWQKALALQPDYQEALINLGCQYRKQQQIEHALTCFHTYRSFYPHHASGWQEIAKTLMEANLPEQALFYQETAFRLASNDSAVGYQYGLLLRQLRRFHDALNFCQSFLTQHSDIDISLLYATLLNETGEIKKAREQYETLLDVAPNHDDIIRAFAVFCHQQSDYQQAVALFHQLCLQPNHQASDWQGQASCYLHLRQLNRALACYRQALMRDKDNADIRHDLSIVLYQLQSHSLAQQFAEKALSEKQDAGHIHNTLALIHYALHDFSSAKTALQRAQSYTSELAEIPWNLAHWHLIQGQWHAGWSYFETRLKAPAFQNCLLPQHGKLWRGEPLTSNDHILLIAEQGVGDTIQFYRFIKQFSETEVKITLEVPTTLVDLLQSQTHAPSIHIIGKGETRPQTDWYCPLMSLAQIFHVTPDTIPESGSYLKIADKNRSSNSAHAYRKIGFAFSGNPAHHNDKARSMPLRYASPLLSLPQTEFYCLQPTRGYSYLGLPDHVQYPVSPEASFMDTAQLIMQMDLVITVDTAVAHLAGALGKPVWILLAFNNDWRWLLQRSDTPWYDSARLFRQSKHGHWSGVINNVIKAIQQANQTEYAS